jgi:hypothetical protein
LISFLGDVNLNPIIRDGQLGRGSCPVLPVAIDPVSKEAGFFVALKYLSGMPFLIEKPYWEIRFEGDFPQAIVG